MAYINLLPWRENARKEKQKEYLTLLSGVGILAFLLMFGVSMFYGERVKGQLKRNAYLSAEILLLDQRIDEIKTLKSKKTSLQQRMALIEQLQSSRNLGTQVFAEIAAVVPAGIYLAELEKKGDSLRIIGKTESNNRLSHMLRQVEESTLLSFVNLQSIVAGTNEVKILSDFTLQLEVNSLALLQAQEKAQEKQLALEKKLAQEILAQEKLAQELRAKEQLAQEKLAQEKLAQEKLQAEQEPAATPDNQATQDNQTQEDNH
ncbi:MAG: type IV pilus assembly protein PilN [Phenylobacterium sp.]|jgi:type IV pilus assembly protein PilN